MIGKFIYVFTPEDCEKLLSSGHTLIKEDRKSNIFVFDNSETSVFGLDGLMYVLSDTLTFQSV